MVWSAKYRLVINREKFLRVEGILQNQDHTISIKASRVLPISISASISYGAYFRFVRYPECLQSNLFSKSGAPPRVSMH
jgi:hypothetical protein